jgi:hypothetical protein
VEVVPLHAPTARARSIRKPRFVVSLGVAAAVVVGLVVVLPTMGGDGARNRAFAVTENADDTVTVEIRSIEDAEGLQRRLQEAGVPAAVYYLPPGKACSPREYDGGSPPIEDRQAEMERRRLTITETEDGAFIFTVDRSRLLPGYTLLIQTQYAAPDSAVPSIGAEYVSGDVSHCEPVDVEVSE